VSCATAAGRPSPGLRSGTAERSVNRTGFLWCRGWDDPLKAEHAADRGAIAVNDQVEATGKQLAAVAENAVGQAREQAEQVRANLAPSDKLAQVRKRATKAAKKAQQVAAERGAELGAEASTRGKAAAKKGAKKGEHALERAIDVTRERGSEALLSALATEPGKRLAATPAGSALKSKLTARKRRRKKLMLLLVANAGGVIAFKQLRSRRLGGPVDAPSPAPTPTETPASIPSETPPPA
jgi:hypothetical protein